MTVQVQEELQGLGDWSIELDYSPALLAELVDANGQPHKLHVLVSDPDGDASYTGVLLRCDPDEGGITIGGRALDWWLGVNDEGPIIEEREFISGNNKLSNGDLALEFLYWDTADAWEWTPGAAYHARSSDTDDVLASSESFSTRPGQEHTATCVVGRLGAVGPGRIHLRLAYTGKFLCPNLLPRAGWSPGASTTYDPDTGAATIGPIPYRQGILNPGFEDGFTGWINFGGSWSIYGPGGQLEGLSFAAVHGGLPSRKYLQADVDPATLDVQPIYVLAGEEWLLSAGIYLDSGTRGEALVSVLQVDQAYPDKNSWVETRRVSFRGADVAGGTDQTGWQVLTETVRIGDTTVALVPSCITWGQFDPDGIDHGTDFRFDAVTLQRTKGNHAYVPGPLVFFVPERSYKWTASVAGAGVVSGDVRLGMTLLGAGRPDLYIESPTHDVKDDSGRIDWDFTPPSGYEYGVPVLVGVDVLGGSFRIADMELRDNDSATLVVDTDSSSADPPGTVLTRTFTTPVGAKTVHFEVVAEADAPYWLVSDCQLRRTSVALSTHADVVRALLKDPVTGEATTITPGSIVGPEVIPYDWEIVNRTNRDALQHFCDVVASPRQEYRVNPDRTLDCGPDIFVDHGPDSAAPVILLPSDIDVRALPHVEANAEQRATQIKIIGTERESTDGETTVITATAEVAGPSEFDWNGRVLRRTRLVEDSTVDHIGYAQALAADLAEREAAPSLSVEVTLAGTGQRPSFDVGDYIYAYKPEAHLEDPDNPITIDGRTVFARRVRVLSRTRHLGPSHRVQLRRLDGTVFDPPGVRWSDADTTDVTLGDKLPDFVSDPQGGAVGKQFLRFRASAAR